MIHEWFQWLVGFCLSIGSAVVSWNTLHMLSQFREHQKQISDHETRLCVIEDRERVSPVEFQKLKNDIENLQGRGPGR